MPNTFYLFSVLLSGRAGAEVAGAAVAAAADAFAVFAAMAHVAQGEDQPAKQDS